MLNKLSEEGILVLKWPTNSKFEQVHLMQFLWTSIPLTWEERKKPVQGRDYTVEKQFMPRESVGSEIGTVQ